MKKPTQFENSTGFDVQADQISRLCSTSWRRRRCFPSLSATSRRAGFLTGGITTLTGVSCDVAAGFLIFLRKFNARFKIMAGVLQMPSNRVGSVTQRIVFGFLASGIILPPFNLVR
ncbi:hypothetical protein [Phyllobacterium zundukense]|uniref:hypothetical protein n=1 Tax=Phyllobacterium zundukense TaxID=1867719 RepID=UPI0010558D68|nr:hypothetical protein [Phyllobacterium zundukense]